MGAPYDGPEGRGTVYIYHGRSLGLSVAPSQVIQASDVNGALSGFGFSLAGESDVDDNRYPGRSLTDMYLLILFVE